MNRKTWKFETGRRMSDFDVFKGRHSTARILDTGQVLVLSSTRVCTQYQFGPPLKIPRNLKDPQYRLPKVPGESPVFWWILSCVLVLKYVLGTMWRPRQSTGNTPISPACILPNTDCISSTCWQDTGIARYCQINFENTGCISPL